MIGLAKVTGPVVAARVDPEPVTGLENETETAVLTEMERDGIVRGPEIVIEITIDTMTETAAVIEKGIVIVTTIDTITTATTEKRTETETETEIETETAAGTEKDTEIETETTTAVVTPGHDHIRAIGAGIEIAIGRALLPHRDNAHDHVVARVPVIHPLHLISTAMCRPPATAALHPDAEPDPRSVPIGLVSVRSIGTYQPRSVRRIGRERRRKLVRELLNGRGSLVGGVAVAEEAAAAEEQEPAAVDLLVSGIRCSMTTYLYYL